MGKEEPWYETVNDWWADQEQDQGDYAPKGKSKKRRRLKDNVRRAGSAMIRSPLMGYYLAGQGRNMYERNVHGSAYRHFTGQSFPVINQWLPRTGNYFNTNIWESDQWQGDIGRYLGHWGGWAGHLKVGKFIGRDFSLADLLFGDFTTDFDDDNAKRAWVTKMGSTAGFAIGAFGSGGNIWAARVGSYVGGRAAGYIYDNPEDTVNPWVRINNASTQIVPRVLKYGLGRKSSGDTQIEEDYKYVKDKGLTRFVEKNMDPRGWFD